MSEASAKTMINELQQKSQNGRVAVTPDKAIELAGKLYTDARYPHAEEVCRQILKQNPDQADAHNILGVALNAQGKTKEAVQMLKRAIKLAPQAASFHANLGEVERQRGNNVDARTAFRKAIELDPRNAPAHNNIGIIHYDRKEFADAAAAYRQAIAINPKFAEAHNNLGNALMALGDRDAAINAYQDALVYREFYPEAYNNLSTLLRDQGKIEEAEHALKKAISQKPNYVEAHNNLAALYAFDNREVDALRVLGEALKLDARNPAALVLTARIQLNRSNHSAAERACRIVIEDQPHHAEALTVLGHILHETDRYEEAIAVLEAALKEKPEHCEARNFYGVALKSVGRLDEAREQILKAIELNESMSGAYANLHDLVDFSKEEELFNRVEGLIQASPDAEAPQMLPLHFAYAKALDDRKDHGRALEHYITGGRMKRALLNYNESETFDFFANIKKAFPAEIFANRPFRGNPSERPVFIVGMPRSGSTLVEQILSSHPDVYGAGEVKYLSRSIALLRDRFPTMPRYPDLVGAMAPAQFGIVADTYLKELLSNAGPAPRVTDKLLTNYFFVGLIHLLFPNAKIINTRRDPVDTCLSAFTKLFKDDMPHSYDLGELGRYYCQYADLMDHWNQVLPAGVMTTIVYENVVGDTEQSARNLIEFLGLPWNEACLQFHKSDRPVKTASVAQVRKPIYNTAVERWRKYGAGLQPLLDALGK